MKKKKIRIVSLLVAVLMTVSMSAMAVAYEDEDVAVDEDVVVVEDVAVFEAEAYVSECGDDCDDHGIVASDGFIGIEPMATCSDSRHNYPYTPYSIDTKTVTKTSNYCSATERITKYICFCGKATTTEYSYSNTVSHSWAYQYDNFYYCTKCGMRRG